MNRRVGLFLGASFVAWAAVAIPARFIWADFALLQSSVAAGICVAPSIVSLAWSDRAFRHHPNQLLLAVLGGTGFRITVVLGLATALYAGMRSLPGWGGESFWGWVLAFYLITLGIEMTVLLAGRPAVRENTQDGA
jgi:hypothetical protein